MLEFYRHIGCDVFNLNNWGLPHDFKSPRHHWGQEVVAAAREEDGNHVWEWRAPRGTLTGVTAANGHPLKYPVDSLEAVRIYREMWENARFTEADDRPAFDALNRLIGDDGIVTRFWGPSTIPRLLENDMGTLNFYYLLNDHPEDMTALIRVIHEKELQAFACLSQGPCEVAILCENTSTYYISPDVYRRFNGPHVKCFVDTMHAAGKVALIHMCGHVLDLLPDIKQTGLDGIHALTPPPTCWHRPAIGRRRGHWPLRQYIHDEIPRFTRKDMVAARSSRACRGISSAVPSWRKAAKNRLKDKPLHPPGEQVERVIQHALLV